MVFIVHPKKFNEFFRKVMIAACIGAQGGTVPPMLSYWGQKCEKHVVFWPETTCFLSKFTCCFYTKNTKFYVWRPKKGQKHVVLKQFQKYVVLERNCPPPYLCTYGSVLHELIIFSPDPYYNSRNNRDKHITMLGSFLNYYNTNTSIDSVNIAYIFTNYEISQWNKNEVLNEMVSATNRKQLLSMGSMSSIRVVYFSKEKSIKEEVSRSIF
jgi:hypothetical protein